MASAASMFRDLFCREKGVVIGMIHALALPGTPRNSLKLTDIVTEACKEAEIYRDLGVDGILIENMHDVPYLHSDKVGSEITACMTVICEKVKAVCGSIPCGVQILAGANKQALAVANAAGCDFIRAEGFVFSHVADEGLMNSCAAELLRYRKQIGAESVRIFTDIKKKHSAHAITSDVSIEDTALAAQFFLSDGVIITGSATGCSASPQEVNSVQSAVELPVLVGSGVTTENLAKFINANGLIVGSYFKHDGNWMNRVNYERVARFMEMAETLRI